MSQYLEIGDLVRIAFYPEERIGIVIKKFSSKYGMNMIVLETFGKTCNFHWTWLEKI